MKLANTLMKWIIFTQSRDKFYKNFNVQKSKNAWNTYIWRWTSEQTEL